MKLDQAPEADSVDHFVRLVGRPPIGDFVRFMKRSAVDGHNLDDVELTQEWREASARMAEVAARERGFADTEDWPDLPPALLAFANAELQQSTYRSSLAYMPYRWALVELDRLVVYQSSINLRFVDRLKRSFPPQPADEDLVRIALGSLRDAPPISITHIDGNTFSFASPSNDLRILGISHFGADKVTDDKLRNGASNILGLFVGFGPNMLQAIRLRKRTILTNGTHRSYALRSMGFTHVPCLVQNVSEDEPDLIIPEIKQHLDRYLTSARPPLFKDYFDSRLHKIVPVPRRNFMLQVELTIKQSMIPSL